MKKKEIMALLVVCNSTNGNWQYPIGNAALTAKIKNLEHLRLIQWDKYNSRWELVK